MYWLRSLAAAVVSGLRGWDVGGGIVFFGRRLEVCVCYDSIVLYARKKDWKAGHVL
jgi:hypothetical protein